MTPSVHSAYKHTRDWYQRHGLSPGLAWYCEQAIESAHCDFYENIWRRGYNVPDTHPKYADRLLKATAKYNADRIS